MNGRRRVLRALAAVVLVVVPFAAPVDAKLTGAERGALSGYLGALVRGDYAAAFARLSPDERRYFRTSANLASIFAADRLKLQRFTILASAETSKVGTVALVRERVSFFDHAHQSTGTMSANVRYGIVPSPRGPAVKDPFHPWFAFAPADESVAQIGVRASVRKVSFFTGRVEVLFSFANTGDRTVTILPYGRSVVRDDAGLVHTPIRSKLAGLTDPNLFEGLRLPPSTQYTGVMTFFTADRFAPKRLEITLAPALADGADAPVEFKLPPLDVPPHG